MMTEEEIAEYSQYIEPERLRYIEHQGKLFEAAKPALIEQYLGEYVAFEDGQVLDHDVHLSSLALRVYDKHGYRDLIMQKVSVKNPVSCV